MKNKSIWIVIMLAALFSLPISATGSLKNAKPVSKNASAESVALLELIYSLTGNYLLTGQHNYPNTKDKNTVFAKFYTGKTPAIYSNDWGHAREGDKDSYLARADIVKECIRQHNKGSLITLCWHAVPPTAEEPVTFRQLPGSNPDSLKSVQGKLLDQQFIDVLTPGTSLYNQWCKQVDSVAVYLKQLQKAKVPVLWRPYHEMNGAWFWWGGRTGEYGTRDLYIQLYERLVDHHKINNLVWVWSVDRFHRPDMYYKQYFPGLEYLDILSLDVYGSDFKKDYYDSLMVLSEGKPLALAEVGNPPAPEVLDEQPNWTFYATWAGMVRNTLKKEYDILLNDPRYLCLEDSSYYEKVNPYRALCKLPLLPLVNNEAVNFTGNWVFCEEESKLGNRGSSQLAWKIKVSQTSNEIEFVKSLIVEFAESKDEIFSYKMDGSQHESLFWNSPQVTTVQWNKPADSLIFKSITTFTWGEKPTEMLTLEKWSLSADESLLSVHLQSDSPWGKQDVILIYEREW